MTDTALAELVRQVVRAEIDRALAPLLPPALDPRQAELLHALSAVFGTSAFTAAECLQVARTPLADRRRLATALAAVGVADATALGRAFGAIARRTKGRPVRLVRDGTIENTTVWCVEGD